MPNNSLYHIISVEEVRNIYRAAHQRYKKAAIEIFNEQFNAGKTNLQRTPKTLKKVYLWYVFWLRHHLDISLFSEFIQKNCQLSDDIKKELNITRQKINKLIKAGIVLKKMRNVSTHKLFHKTTKIYVKINPILSGELVILDTLRHFNSFSDQTSFLSKAEKFKLLRIKSADATDEKWYFENQKGERIKIQAAIKKIIKEINKIEKWCQKNTEGKIRLLIKYILDMDQDEKNGHKIHLDLKNQYNITLNFIPSPFIFKLLQTSFINETDINRALTNIKNNYEQRLNQIHSFLTKSQIKGQTTPIDMLVFSISPRDIVKMSTYTPWNSCTTIPDGSFENSTAIQVAAPSIIVYGINSQNPEQKLARILLKPYVSDTILKKISTTYLKNTQSLQLNHSQKEDDIIATDSRLDDFLKSITDFELNTRENSSLPDQTPFLYIPDKTYGIQNIALKILTSEIVKNHINPSFFKNESVKKSAAFLTDTLEQSYICSSLVSLTRFKQEKEVIRV